MIVDGLEALTPEVENGLPVEYVPGEQVWHAAVGSVEKVPGPHPTHADIPEESAIDPGAHVEHDERPE